MRRVSLKFVHIDNRELSQMKSSHGLLTRYDAGTHDAILSFWAIPKYAFKADERTNADSGSELHPIPSQSTHEQEGENVAECT